MKQVYFIVICIVVFSSCKKQKEFDDYFELKTLRIDYLLSGNHIEEQFHLKQLKRTNIWSGSESLKSESSLDLGNYRFNIYDSISGNLLFQKGFCSLFQEWQATPEAKEKSDSYYHVNLLPFPKQTILYELEKRAFETGEFEIIKSLYINPSGNSIKKESSPKIPVTEIQQQGDPSNKIDLVFLAEGYTINEMGKFTEDTKRIWNYMKSIPPFKESASNFNVSAILSPSEESGTDIPGKGIFKETCLNSHFYTFGVERYLTTSDLKTMHDIAENAPYDHIYIIVNTDRYGGGGFYNYYSLCTSNNELSEKVAIHEFGHSFAGLGDEYYTSDVASEELYNLSIEPWEKNISTLVNFKLKWKNKLSPNTPIPTPRDSIYIDSIGVFEGGGYSAKGIYSPVQDCRMKSNKPEGFCPICSEAIQQVIEEYTN